MTVSSPNPSERTSLPHLRLICLAVLLALSGGPFWPLSGPNPSKRASPALLLLSERTTSLKTGSSPAVLCFCVSFLSLSIHPSIHLSIYPSTCLSIHPLVYLSIYLSFSVCQGCLAQSVEGKALNLKIEGSSPPCTRSQWKSWGGPFWRI